MPDSSITCSALTVTPGIGHNLAKWSFTDPYEIGLPSLQLDAVELWAATSNDRSLASKVAEGRNNAAHMGLIEGATYYYWVKGRNNSGYYGEWFPSGATSGVIGTVGFAAGAAHALINGKLVATVAGNILTVAVKTLSGSDPSATDAVFVGVRDQAGTYAVRQISAALSLAVSNGSTLGSVNSTPFRVWVVAIDNAGVVALGVRICSTATAQFPLAEYGLLSTLAEGGAGGADTAGVAYSASALSSKAFRIIGHLDWTSGLATAGAWSTAPDVIHLFGVGSYKPGDAVQSAFNPYSAYSQQVGLLPYDDTIPQSGEGNQFFATAITPTSKVNYIENEALLNASHDSTSVILTMALFQDSGADALASTFVNSVSAPMSWPLFDRRQPGTISQTTYKIRMGDSTGGATTNSVNGHAGGRKLGGSATSYHRVTERMA